MKTIQIKASGIVPLVFEQHSKLSLTATGVGNTAYWVKAEPQQKGYTAYYDSFTLGHYATKREALRACALNNAAEIKKWIVKRGKV